MTVGAMLTLLVGGSFLLGASLGALAAIRVMRRRQQPFELLDARQLQALRRRVSIDHQQ